MIVPHRRILLLAGSLALCLGLACCGMKLPTISTTEWRIESRLLPKTLLTDDKAPRRYESLSIFGLVKDEEGLENLSEIWIVNDKTAFAWKLSSLDWTKSVVGGDTWLGSAALTLPDLKPLPRGNYRMIVYDAAGNQAESAFTLTGSFPQKDSPTAQLKAGKLSIHSDWPETLALAYDSVGVLLTSVPAPEKETFQALDQLFGSQFTGKISQLAGYGYDPSLKMGAFSERIANK